MIELAAIILFFFSIIFIIKISPPNNSLIFLGLAAVVSLVGINIDLGITIRLSRILLLFFLISFLINWNYYKKIKIETSLYPFLILFALILGNQIISSLLSNHLQDGMSQIFIYINLMILFITVILTSNNLDTIKTGIKIYLFVGLIQALYGYYQIVAGPFGLMTYQSLFMSLGIPMTNDQTVDGFLYSGAFKMFRSTGFFSADVSHYAGYLVGIILIAISQLSFNSKKKYLWLILMFSVSALILSFSRSGQLALILFGLPTFVFCIKYFKLVDISLRRIINVRSVSSISVLIILTPFIMNYLGLDLLKISETFISRFTDLVSIGTNEKESMSVHILTRLQGLDAFFTHPFFGVGMGVNASPWYSEYFGGYAGSHSHHIDILAQTGIVGALLEWSFMVLVLRIMWNGLSVKNTDKESQFILAGIFASVIAILGGNLFYHYYINDFVWFLMATGTSLSYFLINDELNNLKNDL